MSKELPYFKFQPSEWVTGDITLCSMEAQGLFINLCCYYWIRDCDITLANAKQRFSNCFSLVEELLSKEIILLNDDGKIIIKFLDEQMEKFIDISEKRSKSGALKGKQMQSKCKANAPYKEKDKNKIKNKIFIIPTIEEIKLKIIERNITSFTAETFHAHYSANGWMIGKNKMKDWNAALTTWNEKAKQYANNSGTDRRSIKRTNALWD